VAGEQREQSPVRRMGEVSDDLRHRRIVCGLVVARIRQVIRRRTGA
jgi:hypothetical protein